MYEFIPDELKKLNKWICWKAIPDKDAHSGIKKVPVNAKNGYPASSTDPGTWSDFDTAVRASSDFAGIGFVFDGSGYFGVDLDDMPDDLAAFKNGDRDNTIGEFVYGLKSYTELSQSGNGIHIICKGKLPEGRRKARGFEMYEKGRFFVMTGNYCSEFIEIIDCTESIKPLHEKYLAVHDLSKSRTAKTTVPYITPLDMSLNEIIEKARNAANGDKFSRLYDGDISDYNSQSEADMAFCNMLAFWCGCDIELMDSIYRSSGLMRDKWDRKQTGSTYGRLTLEKAVSQCNNVYSAKTAASADNNYSISIGAKDKIKKKLYSFDDTGNADRMYDAFGEYLRYCYVDKKWLYYRDGKWSYDNIGECHRVADVVLELMRSEERRWQEHEGGIFYDDFKKHLKRTRSSNAKKAMLKELEHRVPILPKNMDTQRMEINCKNGIIDLRSGRIIPHDISKFMTKMLNVPMPEKPKKPELWLRFLDDIFSGDKELIRYVQKAVGYSLTGSTSEQCAFFLYGTGRNGKSTFIEVIRYIMGDYASNIQSETIMIKRSGNAANSDIARLKGARLVTAEETNEGERLNESLIKQLTGGDIVTARKLYGEEFEFKPEFKLWMATNHKPIVRGTDIGIWRRLHIIPFKAAIPVEKVDKNIKYRLYAEMPDILAWAVEGCQLWLTEGLRPTKAIAKAVEEYKHESDVISAFIDACCIKIGEVKAGTLYAVYSKWAEENNEYKMSSTKFGREITLKYNKKNKKDGIYYIGIQVVDKDQYSISIG